MDAAAPVDALCKLCGLNQGRPYSFHYGKKVAQSGSQTSWVFDGTQSAHVCAPCLRRRRVRSLLMCGVGLLVGFGLAGFGILMAAARLEACFGLFLFASIGVGLVSLWGVIFFLIKRDDDLGSELAIAAESARLRQRGYDTFVSPDRYKKLQGRG
jgi:hypothetical protein